MMELAAEDAEAEMEAKEAAAAPGAAAAKVASQAAGEQAVRAAEADDASGGDDDQQGDFVFEANGARVGAGHAAAEVSDDEGGAALATASVEDGPARKKKRCARKRAILLQAPGMEASADGEARVETEAPRRRGIFTAAEYFWLYYAADGVKGLTTKVDIKQGSGPHGVHYWGLEPTPFC
jgi:hypothetical protein